VQLTVIGKRKLALIHVLDQDIVFDPNAADSLLHSKEYKTSDEWSLFCVR
jgi:hypothetical protein